jgi:hypothetical protein
MVRVHRIDTYELAKPVRRADGSLVVQAKIARTGVQVYRNTDGSSRREYRPDSEVFSTKTLDSFKLVPFTLGHPPVMVTPENVTLYSRGTVGENIRRDGKWMIATIVVHAKDAIDAIESGVRQVSCGYACDLEMKAGVSPDGEHFDCVQHGIEGNHVAGVVDARAGAEAAIRMDAAISDDTLTHKDSTMDTAALTKSLTDALENVAKLTARVDSLTTEVTDLKTKNTQLSTDAAKLTAERDNHKDRADKADKARLDAVASNPAKVKERVALEGSARKILGKRCDAAEGKPAEVDLDKLNDRDVKLAVIKHVTNVDCAPALAGKDESFIDAYVSARYDGACERAVASADTFRGARDVIETNRADARPTTDGSQKRADARAEMIAANRASGIPSKDATAAK